MPVALLLREEFLDGGEDHAAGFHGKLGAQVGPVLRLNRGLAQQVGAAREGGEELVVEVVAVGQHHHGRVCHRRLADDATGVERHGEALARTLGMPDDADPPVARRATRPAAGLVAAAFFPGDDQSRPLQFGRAQGLGHGRADRVELVITGHLLGEYATPVVLEDDEVAYEREEPRRRADTLQHHLQLRHRRGSERLAGDRAPRLEPLPPGSERADARLKPVRDDERRVHGEERRQLGLVGLELLPCGPDGRVLACRVLEFDQPERQSVDEQHHVRAPLVLVFHNGNLVDRQPVVAVRVLEIHDTHLRAPDVTVIRAVLHRHAVHDHAVEGAVADLDRRPFRPRELVEGVIQCLGRKVRVQLLQRRAQATFQHDRAIVGTLRTRRIGGDVGAMGDEPAKALQPSKRGLLDDGLRYPALAHAYALSSSNSDVSAFPPSYSPK